jgi:hypothetical protein
MNDFSIPNTDMNRSLASTIAARVGAEARAVSATATFWRLLGFGGFMLLAGLGAGAACWGYARINDQRDTAQQVATAIADALGKTTLKTEGVVKADGTVRAEGTVALAPGATVRLDSAGASVVSPPPPRQLQSDNVPPSNAKPVTNYAVFKHVQFGKGEVWTGWNFRSSADSAPSFQYCYYTEDLGSAYNASIKYDIGANYTMTPPKAEVPIDVAAAFQNCVWFR